MIFQIKQNLIVKSGRAEEKGFNCLIPKAKEKKVEILAIFN